MIEYQWLSWIIGGSLIVGLVVGIWVGVRYMREKTARAISLSREILDFAKHGDYSNGNTEELTTIDEGNVRATECLDTFESQLSILEEVKK